MRSMIALCEGAMVVVAFLLLSTLMAGCASTESYGRYLAAQAQATQAAIKAQKPLLKITAQSGQAITGLSSIEVYGQAALPTFQQERPNEWAAVAQSGLQMLGVVGGVIAGGRAAEDLANAVGKSSTYGYQYIQASGPVTTNNTSTLTTSTTDSHAVDSHNTVDSHAISGSYNPVDNTGTPTVVYQPAPVVVTP